MKKSTSIIIFVLFIMALAVILGITVHELKPVFQNFGNQAAFEAALNEYKDDIGLVRAAILVVLQFCTVMMVILPAEPVEIVSGITYGMLWGTLICLIGVIIANIVIYLLFKKTGDAVLKYFPNYLGWESKLVKRNNRFGRIVNVSLLYILPFIPYGVIAVIASRSKLRFIPYLIVTSLGSLPSIAICTIMTGAVLDGHPIVSAIIVGIVILCVILTIVIKVIQKRNRERIAKRNKIENIIVNNDTINN